MNVLFVCLTIESLWDVDRDVSTAILLVFIRRWGRLFMCRYLCTLVRCDWCISILIIIPTNRWCSLIGPPSSWTAVIKTGHFPLWNQVKFIDRDPHRCTRRVKEAIHIRLHSNNINRDSGIEIPEAWIPTIRKHNSRSTRRRTYEGTSSVSRSNNEDRNAPITANQRA